MQMLFHSTGHILPVPSSIELKTDLPLQGREHAFGRLCGRIRGCGNSLWLASPNQRHGNSNLGEVEDGVLIGTAT